MGCTTPLNEMLCDMPFKTSVPLEEFSVTEITIPLPMMSAEAENLKLCKLPAGSHELPFKPRELLQMSHQSLPAPVGVAGFAPCHKEWLTPSQSVTSMVLQACTTWPACPQCTSTGHLRTNSTTNIWIFKIA